MATEININVKAEEVVAAIRDLTLALTGGPGLQLNVPQPAPQPVVPQPMPQQAVPATPQSVSAPVMPTSSVVPVVAANPTPPPAAPVAVVPTTAPTYAMEQLAVAATQLVDAGRRQEIVNLLAGFGVQALTQLDKSRYGEFATALRGLGVKI